MHNRKQWPNACNLNYYQSGASSVDWHADSEEMFEGRIRHMTIISLSLGASLTFQLKHIGPQANVKDVQLRDDDLLTMEGRMQYFYKHRAPKAVADGPRINRTWRLVVQHKQHYSGSPQIGPERLKLS